MKTAFKRKQLLRQFFCISLITFHIHLVRCRPSLSYVDSQNILQNIKNKDTADPPQVRSSYGSGNEVKQNCTMVDKCSDANDTLHLYTEKDFTDFLSSDVNLINPIENDEFHDDTPTRSDVNKDVIPNKEGSVPRHQEGPFTDRNLVRKRRQPEPHRPHRRRRRKHRLLLKARNHLDGEEDLKGRRDRLLIKSDSPEYVITSASEVKKDWCRTIPLRQKISEPNCRSKVIHNNFCYGQCNSFFIPHTGRTDNKVAFQSCSFCKPSRQRWGNVTLNCPGSNPPTVQKTVLYVETCKCISEIFQ